MHFGRKKKHFFRPLSQLDGQNFFPKLEKKVSKFKMPYSLRGQLSESPAFSPPARPRAVISTLGQTDTVSRLL
jgi:hypothetical protein